MAGQLQYLGSMSLSRPGAQSYSRRLLFFCLGFLAAAGPLLSVALNLPDFLRWIDEVLVSLLFLIAFPQAVLEGRIRQDLSVILCLVIYSLVSVLSGLANSIPLVEAALGWRSLAQFYIYYLILVWLKVDSQDVQRFFAAFLLTALLHSLLALQQYQLQGGAVGYDDITGGFGRGTANLFGYFSALSVVVCLCLVLIAGWRMFLLFIPPIGIAWVMASAQGSYLLTIPLGVLAVLLSPTLRKFKRLMPFAAVFLLGAIVLNEFVVIQFNSTIARSLLGNLSNLTKYNVDDYGNPGRLALLSSAIRLISGSWLEMLVGIGTGSVASNLGEGILNTNFWRLALLSGAVYTPSSVVQILAEIGLLGLSIAYVLLVQVFRSSWQARNQTHTRVEQSWILAAVLLIPFFALAGLGEIVWTFQPVAYPIWTLAAFATVLRRANRQTQPW